MNCATPRPDQPDESGGSNAWEVEGSAGREAIAPGEADSAARTYWEAEADAYQAEHGAFLADPAGRRAPAATSGAGESGPSEAGFTSTSFVWGPEGVTEAELGLLGPLDTLTGRRVLEVGCGAAQCSAWLAERGVLAVGIDIAVNQLRHAVRALSAHAGGPLLLERQEATGFAPGTPRGTGGASRGADPAVRSAGNVRVVAATATALPFADAAFDAAFAAYGAIQFVADLPLLLAEVRRVLAPGGRWVFSVTHPIRWAFPDDPGPAGLSASGSYFDRTPYVERDGDGAAEYAEFHRTIGDYVRALRGAGFTIDAMVEPEWPEWNEQTWGGWSPLRGTHLPGTLIIGCRADGRTG